MIYTVNGLYATLRAVGILQAPLIHLKTGRLVRIVLPVGANRKGLDPSHFQISLSEWERLASICELLPEEKPGAVDLRDQHGKFVTDDSLPSVPSNHGSHALLRGSMISDAVKKDMKPLTQKAP